MDKNNDAGVGDYNNDFGALGLNNWNDNDFVAGDGGDDVVG